MANKQKTIRLFLASSDELKHERDEFEILIRRRNKSWKKRGVYLELEIWEDFLEAMSQTRSQDEYNKLIKQCDIFVMLFFTKVGKYSAEEFDIAYELFKETDKPLIFTYFKNAEILSGNIDETDTASLLAFKKKLQNLEHFHSEYKNIDDLKFQFSDQLDKIYDDIISEGAEVDEIPGQTDQLFINIIHDGKNHRSRVTRGSDGSPLVDQLIHLSKSDKIEIKGRKYPLGEIIEALYSKSDQERQIFFDENAQIEIGRYLFDEIFGPLSSAEKTTMFSAQGGTIYIACDSVWILTLPWLFLSDSEGLLFMRNWSISFTHPRFADQQPEDVESGSRHRVLIIAPDAEGQPMTHSEQHLEKLKTMLSSQADWLTESARYLRVVKTWDEFVTALDELKPNIVYYYGNANGEGLGTELVFADENNNPHGINLTEFSNHLKTKSSSVELLYLNCCQGNVHGFSAIGNLLRGAVPALLTNRPYASVQTAGDLAVEILLRILFHNMPPHVTLQGVAWNRQSEDLAARSSPDWVNLTLFRNYRAWHSFSVSRKSSRIPDPIWHVKIDRRHQFNMVSGNVRLMLLYQRPKSYAFIWYGLQDQGQEVFHQRLNSELQEVFNEVDLIEFSPQWPLFPEGGNYDDLFTAMIKQAFGANQDLDEVPGIIRRHTHDSGNRQTLVYVRHTPVTSKKHLSPEQLQKYLKWWDLFAVPQFHEGVYGLLGISFVVKNPAVFKEVMDKRRIGQVKGYKNSQVEVLDKLDKLVEDDLIRFFDTHDVKIPEEAYEPIAKKIIRESNGVYNSTLKLIEREIYKYWDDAKEEVIINEDKEEDEDY